MNNHDLPCTRCVAKGYPCGPKTLGDKSQVIAERNEGALVPISRPLAMPTYISWHDLLRPKDRDYLRYYDVTFRSGCKSRELIYVSAGISYVPFYRLDIDVTSRPLTAAALTLAAFACHGHGNEDTDLYYTNYIASADPFKNINSDNLENLMYASYVMATLKCLYEKSTVEVLAHCAQFCRLVQNTFERDLPKKERLWIIALWHAAVRAAYHHYWVQQNLDCFGKVDARAINVKHKELSFQLFQGKMPIDSDWRRSSLDKLLEVLDISAPFAYKPGSYFDVPKNLHNSLIYLQIYLERFLFQAASEHHVFPVRNPATVPLLSVLVQITSLIEQLPPCTTLLDQWSWAYDIISTAPCLLDAATSDAPPVFKCKCLQLKLLDPLSIAMLYGSSQLFLRLLQSYDLDNKEDDVLEACNLALATVLLIWSNRTMAPETTYPALVRRSLFWSGIVLFKGGVSIGIEYPSLYLLTLR